MNLTEKDIQRYWIFLPTRQDNSCWQWQGATAGLGYGQLRIENCNVSAHRIAWYLEHGDIPDNTLILHHCDNTSCCNPAHLYAGTHSDNLHDAWERGRRTRTLQTKNKHLYPRIREEAAQGIKPTTLAIKYNLSCRQVNRIIQSAQ